MFCFFLKVSHKAEMKIKIILDVWDEFPPPPWAHQHGLTQTPAAHVLQPLIQGKHLPKDGEPAPAPLTSVALSWAGHIGHIKLQMASSPHLSPLSP